MTSKLFVGLGMWFRPGAHETTLTSDQPLAAIVTYVHHDALVNLVVFGKGGEIWQRNSVPIWDGSAPDAVTPRGNHAEFIHDDVDRDKDALAERDWKYAHEHGAGRTEPVAVDEASRAARAGQPALDPSGRPWPSPGRPPDPPAWARGTEAPAAGVPKANAQGSARQVRQGQAESDPSGPDDPNDGPFGTKRDAREVPLV